MGDPTMTIERLTLECGHFRLSGPWDSAYENGEPRHQIGDISWCEVCPRVPARTHVGMEFAVRQIVNVEPVDPRQYREPEDSQYRARMDQLCD